MHCFHVPALGSEGSQVCLACGEAVACSEGAGPQVFGSLAPLLHPLSQVLGAFSIQRMLVSCYAQRPSTLQTNSQHSLFSSAQGARATGLVPRPPTPSL